MRGADQCFVIVGAGQAGARAVAELKALHFRGTIVLVGAEEYLPYERPPLTKGYLCDSKATATPANPVELYDSAGVRTLLGVKATQLDCASRSLELSDGTVLGYDKLLLCTGASPRLLDLPGRDLRGIAYLRTLGDAEFIRRRLRNGARVIVIGGGFIGLETAASARKLGCETTVIEVGDRLMGRAVPPAISDFFLSLHRKEGVTVHLGERPIAFEGAGAVSGVRLSSGRIVEGDLVIVGIGVLPETSLARSGGLVVEDGIVVDEYCRTSEPDVFAAGDATRHPCVIAGRPLRLECWQNALDQASTAARVMLGELHRYEAVPWVWSDQYECNLQLSGIPQASESFVARGDSASPGFTLFQLHQGVVTAAASVNRGADMLWAKRLIAQRRSVDPMHLIDSRMPLKALVAQATPAPVAIPIEHPA